MKYQLSEDESEILPNLLGLKTKNEVALAEFEGFLKAEIILTETLTKRTRFDTNYITNIHKLSLGHLYSFAGKFRSVNLSKGGFPFAAAKFLPETIKSFQEEILSQLPDEYESKNQLIKDIAITHAELLMIHPFREGNGRTARILANLMARKQGYKELKFELINDNRFQDYVKSVQQAVTKEYSHMEEIIRLIFPG